jgi:hypothetical protein
MAEYALDIIGRIDGLQRELGKVPGATDQAAFKAAVAIEKRLAAGAKAAAKQTKVAAEEAVKSWQEAFADIRAAGQRQAQEQAQNMEELGRRTNAVASTMKKFAGGIGLGPIANDVDDIVEGMGVLGPLAIAAAGGVALIGGGVYALKELGTFIFEGAMAARELEEELQQLQAVPTFKPIDPELMSAADEARVAFEALKATGSELALVMGTGWAPTIRDFLVTLQTGATFIVDAERALSEMQNSGDGLANTLYDIALAWDNMDERAAAARVHVQAQAAVKKGAEDAEKATRAWEQAQREAEQERAKAAREAEKAAREAEQAEAAKVRAAEKARREYEKQLDAIRELYDIQDAANEDLLTDLEKIEISYEEEANAARQAAEAAGASQEELDATLRALADRRSREVFAYYESLGQKNTEAANKEIAETLRAEEEKRKIRAEAYAWLAEREAEIAAEAAKANEESAEAAKQAWDVQLQALEMYQQAAFEILASIQAEEREATERNIEQLERELETRENLTKQERAALRAKLAEERRALADLAKREKDAAVLSTLLSQAVAIAKAVASAPFPANLPIIAAQSALAAAQVYAATRAPLPKQHTGDLGTSMAPDEHLAVRRKGEVTMNERLTQKVIEGNRNGRLQSDGPVVQQLFFNGRVLAEMVGLGLEEPGRAQRYLEERMPYAPGSAPGYQR